MAYQLCCLFRNEHVTPSKGRALTQITVPFPLGLAVMQHVVIEVLVLTRTYSATPKFKLQYVQLEGYPETPPQGFLRRDIPLKDKRAHIGVWEYSPGFGILEDQSFVRRTTKFGLWFKLTPHLTQFEKLTLESQLKLPS